jgi:hypothetical protein
MCVYLRICFLRYGGIVPLGFDPFHLDGPSKDPQTSVSVGVRFGWYGRLYRWSSDRDRIIGIWLEPIPGHPMSSPIVFVNPTFVPSTPFILSFV